MPDTTTRMLAVAAFGAGVALGPACQDDRLRSIPPPNEHTDAYDQAGARLIDVLWVIDNSCSMAEEQDALAESFYQFIALFARGQIDYRIGVTTTDVFSEKGELLGYPSWNPPPECASLGTTAVITPPPRTPDPVLAFQRNVKVGIGGKGLERGLEAMQLALDKQKKLTDCVLQHRQKCTAGCAGRADCVKACEKKYAPDFMRPDAYLYAVVVSDEEDHSFGEVWYFARYLEQVKGIGNEGTTAFAAIVGEAPRPSCNTAQTGARYLSLADLTGGVSGTICAANFTENLKALAYNAAGLRRRFPLTATPDTGTIEVRVLYRCDAQSEDIGQCDSRTDECSARPADDPYGITCVVPRNDSDGYTYEPAPLNSIFFNNAAIPGLRSKVEIHYVEPTKPKAE